MVPENSLNSGRRFRDVYVVGGGTAGWLTALFVKKKFSQVNVTVIESDDIGILGAGEGTTPSFVEFLDLLDIPLSRLINEADATIKHGIKFSRWGREDFYYHGFLSSNDVGLTFLDSPLHLYQTNVLSVYLLGKGKSLNEASFSLKAAEEGKVCFYPKASYSYSKGAPPTERFNMKSNFALHFNARKLADLLKNVAVSERDIVRVEGKVVGASLSEDGEISSLKMDDGDEYPCDFVFDCTGFSRIFSQGIYESPWIGYEKYLTVDSAQTFFMPSQEDISPYTESVALDYGWAWDIPLQSRRGCGYVYDSKKASNDQIKEEIVRTFGQEVEFGQRISFKPGCLQRQWNKNCVAIGLSSGFIEPLEATSILTSIIALKKVLFDARAIVMREQDYIDKFNREMVEVNEEVLSFVYFHYVCEDTRNEFWSHYTLDNAPSHLKNLISRWNKGLFRYTDLSGVFPLESWISVAEGVGYKNKELLQEVYNYNLSHFDLDSLYEESIAYQDKIVKQCVKHRTFLEHLR